VPNAKYFHDRFIEWASGLAGAFQLVRGNSNSTVFLIDPFATHLDMDLFNGLASLREVCYRRYFLVDSGDINPRNGPAFLTSTDTPALDFISRNALDSTRRMEENHALFIFIQIKRTRIGEEILEMRSIFNRKFNE